MTTLKAGDTAPDFSAPDQTGETRSLADYSGKKLVLYFYPKDDTPGCTAEACNLRDNYARFQAAGYEILGVSPDAPKKHVKFIDKYDLQKFMGREYEGIHRTTFVIGADGKLEDVILKVKTKDHTAQLLAE